MQTPLLSTTYAYDSQQVIYIFNKMRVKVNTQRSRVKQCNTQRLLLIKLLLTDDIISENRRMLGLPIGNYYASLGNKYVYFYATQCVNESPVDRLTMFSCVCHRGGKTHGPAGTRTQGLSLSARRLSY